MGSDIRTISRVLWLGREHDLTLQNGRIEELAPSQPSAGGTAESKKRDIVLLPALMDCHTHLRDPGQEYKEDIETGLAAAASGGFGRILCMPNTSPVNDNAAVTATILQKARQRHPQGPALHPVGAVSPGLAGEGLSPLHELAQAGCIAYTNDGLPLADTALARKAMEYSADLGLKIIDHCEDSSLSRGGVINEGRASSRLGLQGVPSIAESIQVARDILLASYLDLPVHLAHISCRESVELIHWAKSKGVQVSAETCPHYLLWSDQDIPEYDPLYKVNPPLGSPDDVLALRQAVREGVIDILATDHAPHAPFEKEMPFSRAPSGISGLDTALSLTWSLVRDGELSQKDLIRLWCHRPAELFGVGTNRFHPGDPADFVLFSPGSSWTPTPETMRSRGKNTPALNQELPGNILLNCREGEAIYGTFPEETT